ncbi:MAG: PD-(D/E)XK nuclease family protein [Ignavibacteria bacterium]|nr:PD-(D/E)XK nuclease family protein [Ignavibacteria bacterium]
MSKTFLNKIANDFIKSKRDLNSTLFVFPSRRAGLYFKKEISSVIKKTMFAPNVCSMNDFIYSIFQSEETENLILNYELFKTYQKVYKTDKHKNFETFFDFGNIVLEDFTNIDKNLVDVKNLFKIIRNYKEIEKIFPNPIEEDEYLMTFKNAMESQPIKDDEFFITFWDKIDDLYKLFNENLIGKGLFYEGAIYRKVAEEKNLSDIIKYDNVLFCGLNYLSLSERKIISELLNSGKGEIFIDADKYFFGNKFNEASAYLNVYEKWFNIKKDKINYISDNILNEKKNIYLYNVASESGQVNVLNDILSQNNMDNSGSVVILPDTDKLIPVLNSIPDNYGKFNITINYPVSLTSIKEFIFEYLDLTNSIRVINDEIFFPNNKLFRFLLHPYLKFTDTTKFYKLKNDTDEIHSVSLNTITSYIDKNISDQLKEFKSLESLSESIINILQLIFESLIEYEQNDIESSTLIKVIDNLNYIQTIIKNADITLDLESYKILLNEVLSNESISLKGDPLTGLQIMGLYESRAIDFENVIIINANEGILPPAVNNNSIIPMNLKRFYKMTLPEDLTKNFAYMFYRLLIYAKNLYLIYSSDISSDSKEESRYIKQLEYELKDSGLKKINFNFNDTEKLKSKNIEIKKEGDVLKTLELYKSGGKNSFSASSINNYRECSLRFCFDYVMRLNIPEELTLEIDPATFGTHIHNLMLNIYNEKSGKTVDKNFIQNKINELDKIINNFLESEYANNDIYKGKFILQKKMLYDYCNLILKTDYDYAPFKILHLEKSFKTEFFVNDEIGSVNLKAKIDRIDEKNGMIRILDYKTGEIKFCNADKYEKLFDTNEHNAQFQLYLYALIFNNSITNLKPENLITGAYSLRSGDNGIFLADESYNDNEMKVRFENYLREKFVEIYDVTKPFVKTEKKENCKYCNYIDNCLRNSSLDEN